MPVKRKPVSLDFFNFDEAVLRILAHAYGLTGIDSFLPILLDGEFCSLLEVRSETSRKMVIEAETGKFFLKQIPWYCDDEPRLRFSHAFQVELAAQGMPVPRIIPTLSGGTWVTVGDLKFVLFEYCGGLRYDGSATHLVSAARNLAEVHNVAFSFPTMLSENLFDLVLGYVDLLEQCLIPRPGAGELKFLQALERFKSLVLDEFVLRVKEARTQCVRHGWNDMVAIGVHGDYSPWNLLFNESDRVCGLLDFDNCDLGPRLHDIAEALVTFCTLDYREDSTNFLNTVPTESIGPKTKDFLHAYTSVSELNEAEWKCLPWVIRAILVELFCLGTIRGDFGLDEYPAMLDCLDSEIVLP